MPRWVGVHVPFPPPEGREVPTSSVTSSVDSPKGFSHLCPEPVPTSPRPPLAWFNPDMGSGARFVHPIRAPYVRRRFLSTRTRTGPHTHRFARGSEPGVKCFFP